jgi:hypothetical protein
VKGRPFGPLSVGVEGLGVEALAELHDLSGGDQVGCQLVGLASLKVLKEQLDLRAPGGQLVRDRWGRHGQLLMLLGRSSSVMLRCPHLASKREVELSWEIAPRPDDGI